MRGPGFEPGLTPRKGFIERIETSGIPSALRIKFDELKQLAQKFLSRYKNPETKRGYEGPINKLLQELGGQDLDREFIIQFRDKWRYEPYGEILFKKLKVFFNWLKEKKPEMSSEIEEWRKMLKWEGRKEVEFYAEETKNVEWLQKIIDKVLSLRIKRKELNDAFIKLRFIAGVVLAATTGLRPFEHKKITWDLIDLKKDYFILPAEISKTPFSRVIPLTPESKWLLKALKDAWQKNKKALQLKENTIWPYKEMRKVIDELHEKGIEFTMEDLRDMATTMSQNILGVPPALEAVIAGHQTGKFKLEIESYIKMAPKDLAKEYLKYWADVEILTSEQRKEVQKLINKLK